MNARDMSPGGGGRGGRGRNGEAKGVWVLGGGHRGEPLAIAREMSHGGNGFQGWMMHTATAWQAWVLPGDVHCYSLLAGMGPSEVHSYSLLAGVGPGEVHCYSLLAGMGHGEVHCYSLAGMGHGEVHCYSLAGMGPGEVHCYGLAGAGRTPQVSARTPKP